MLGEFKNGKREGNGKVENERAVYCCEGEWQNDLMNGNGIYKDKFIIYEGMWKDGIRQGKGTIKYLTNFKNIIEEK